MALNMGRIAALNILGEQKEEFSERKLRKT
jgi:hypothetical protein